MKIKIQVNSRTILVKSLIVLMFGLLYTKSFSQNYREWTGSGIQWSTNSNWSSGGITYGQLEWKGNGNASSVNDAGSPYSSWRFYFSGSKAYTLTGNAVSLFDNSGSNSWILNDATANQTINLNINFYDGGARTSWITNKNTGTLTFGGNIDLGGNITALRIASTASTAATLNFNGAISGTLKPIDIGTDEFGIIRPNTRVFFNTANNSLTGPVTIYGGTLTIASNTALGTNTTLTIGSGTNPGTLSITDNTIRSQNIFITNTSSASVIDVASAKTFELSGVLSGGSANTTKFGKSGAGTLTLTGTATYNGQLQIGDGTVIVNNNSGLGTNNTTGNRGVDLGLNVADVSQSNNVSLLATTGITVPQSIYVAPNTSSATRTIGLSGSGSATFSNEIYLDGNLTCAPLTGGTLTISGKITGPVSPSVGTSGLITSTGTITLTNTANDYKGTTTINAGAELRLNPSGNATYASQIVLNGGTLSTTSITSTSTFTSSNTLNLSASSTIALGTGNHTLTFANSSAVTWNGATLTVSGWTGTAGQTNTDGGKIFVGVGGLTGDQIAKITFNGFYGSPIILSSGELVPQGPSITYSNTQFTSARNIIRGTTELPLYRFQLDVAGVNTTLSSLTFSTPSDITNSNYINTDVSNFKVFLTTSPTFSNSIQLGSTSVSGKVQQNIGETGITFTGLNTVLNTTQSYYIWLTADVLNGAVAGRNIIINSPTVGIIGNVTGTNSSTGSQTIIAGAAVNYFLQDNAAGTAANWNTSAGGGGSVLGSLGASDVNLIVDNETAATITGDLTLGNNSKIIVSQGLTAKLTIATAIVTGTIDVGSNGTLEINTTNTPTIGVLTSGSTISYGFVGAQTIANYAYSNLITSGSGVKSLGTNLSIAGTFTNNSNLSIGANTLTLNGSILGNGVLTGGTSSNLTITGTSGTIYFDQGTPGITNVLKNLTISGSATTTLGNAINITSGSNFGVVTVGSGATLNTGGFLTLKSVAAGTACVSNSAGTISGNVTVERYISSAGRRWRFLSSPVQSKTIVDWRNQFAITGPGTLSNSTIGDLNSNGWHQTYNNTVNNTAATNTSVRLYVEANSTLSDLNLGWGNVSTTTPLTAGQGFRAFIRGPVADKANQLGASGNSYSQAAVTLSLIGSINSGDIAAPSLTNAFTGWNLLGNPYPCSFDWNAFYDNGTNLTNINPTAYIFDATTNAYVSYNALSNGPSSGQSALTGGIIPSGAAFFVQANGSSPSITFKESYKTTSAAYQLQKSAITDEFNIKYSKDSIESDNLFIKILDGSTLNSDIFDIKKIRNENLNLAAFGVDSMNLYMSVIPSVVEETRIKLNVEATEIGTYKFEFTNLDNFDPNVSVHLFDRFTNTTTDVKANNLYNFEMGAGENQWGKNRFELILNLGKTNVNEFNQLTRTEMFVYPNPANNVLNINFNNANFKNSNIVIFNVSGKEVLKSNMADSNTQLNIESLSSGVYFVKVSNENGFNKTVKFVK
jgi:autotransporter-associated beta strand protein